MMMISPGRNKRRPFAPALHQLESENTAIEFERTFEIGNLQVHVTDPNSRINRVKIFVWCEHQTWILPRITRISTDDTTSYADENGLGFNHESTRISSGAPNSCSLVVKEIETGD